MWVWRTCKQSCRFTVQQYLCVFVFLLCVIRAVCRCTVCTVCVWVCTANVSCRWRSTLKIVHYWASRQFLFISSRGHSPFYNSVWGTLHGRVCLQLHSLPGFSSMKSDERFACFQSFGLVANEGEHDNRLIFIRRDQTSVCWRGEKSGGKRRHIKIRIVFLHLVFSGDIKEQLIWSLALGSTECSPRGLEYFHCVD